MSFWQTAQAVKEAVFLCTGLRRLVLNLPMWFQICGTVLWMNRLMMGLDTADTVIETVGHISNVVEMGDVFFCCWWKLQIDINL